MSYGVTDLLFDCMFTEGGGTGDNVYFSNAYSSEDTTSIHATHSVSFLNATLFDSREAEWLRSVLINPTLHRLDPQPPDGEPRLGVAVKLGLTLIVFWKVLKEVQYINSLLGMHMLVCKEIVWASE